MINHGSLAWPLTELLREDNFHWRQEAEAAFQALKVAMTRIPILALQDFCKPFIVETDASGTGIG